MSVELGIMLSGLGVAALFFYAAFHMSDRHSVFATALFLLGMFHIGAGTFLGRMLAEANGYSDIAGVLDTVFLGQFMMFFVALLYFGIVIYMNDAFKAATQTQTEEDTGYSV